MDQSVAIQVWNEICFLLSESIKSGISEKDFESQVVRAIESLGWKEYAGEIKRQQELPIGRKTIIRPDVVVYGPNEIPLIAIEIKRPSEKLTREDSADQLTSYMLQMKAEFGLLIGNRIRLYYDGKENRRRKPILLQRINFEKDNVEGVQFVGMFNRQSFLNKENDRIIKNLFENFTAGRNIRKLRESFKDDSTIQKIFRFLKDEYSDFGTEVVEGALNGLRIKLSYDSDSEELTKVGTYDDEPKGGMLDIVLDTVKRNREGTSKAEIVNITGFTDRQISNVIYKLKKRDAVIDVRRGVYKAVKDEVPPKPKKVVRKEKRKRTLQVKPSHQFREGTVLADLYKILCRRKKSGFTTEELKIESGLDSRQLSNALYKLVKWGYIQAVERGRYQVL